MRRNPKEKLMKSRFLRIKLGFAYIVDGIVLIFTLGTVNAGLTLKVSRELAKSRMNNTDADKHRRPA